MLAVAVALGILWATVGTYVDLFAVTIAFVSVMLALVFLTIGATINSDTGKPAATDMIMSVASLAAGIYFFIDSERIITRITLFESDSARSDTMTPSGSPSEKADHVVPASVETYTEISFPT